MTSRGSDGREMYRVEGADTRCSFCGKLPQDVHTILTSRESAICDECVVGALDTISRQPGYLFVRIAFRIFRYVASLNRLFRLGPGM